MSGNNNNKKITKIPSWLIFWYNDFLLLTLPGFVRWWYSTGTDDQTGATVVHVFQATILFFLFLFRLGWLARGVVWPTGKPVRYYNEPTHDILLPSIPKIINVAPHVKLSSLEKTKKNLMKIMFEIKDKKLFLPDKKWMSDRHECDDDGGFPLGHWSVTHRENEISAVAPSLLLYVCVCVCGLEKRAQLEKIKKNVFKNFFFLVPRTPDAGEHRRRRKPPRTRAWSFTAFAVLTYHNTHTHTQTRKIQLKRQ